MNKYQMFKARNYSEGYQNAMADIAAVIASNFGSDAEVLAAVEEWLKNNTHAESADMVKQRISEFLS